MQPFRPFYLTRIRRHLHLHPGGQAARGGAAEGAAPGSARRDVHAHRAPLLDHVVDAPDGAALRSRRAALGIDVRDAPSVL